MPSQRSKPEPTLSRSACTPWTRPSATSLLIDGWQGRAASTYDESWVEWRNGAENIIGALNDLAQVLRAAADDYEQTDDDTSVAVSNAPRSGVAI